MGLITFFALMCFAALSGGILGAIVGISLYLLQSIFLFVVASLIILIGLVDDYLYDRKVATRKAEFRLPFYYRWKGWKIGGNYDCQKTGIYYDRKRNRMIPIFR